MSRQYFGTWGLELADWEFARALAARGALAADRGSTLSDPKTFSGSLKRLISLERVPFTLRRHAGLPPANEFVTAWDDAVSGRPDAVRIEIHSVPIREIDPFWLVRTLRLVAPGVSFRQDEPRVPVGWDWPLRIGLLNDTRSRELGDQLSKVSRSHLFQLVDVDGVRRECDLLLIPHNLRDSLALLLERPGRFDADCVVVLGASKVSSSRAMTLMRAIRSEVETAGVCVASVSWKIRAAWVDSLFVHLSHNQPLDIALGAAAAWHQTSAPLLICSSRLLDVARLSAFVERFAATLKRAAREEVVSVAPRTASLLGISEKGSIQTAAAELTKNLPQFHFAREGDHATELVNFRKEVEGQLHERVTLAMADGGGGEPEPEEKYDRRYVQSTFLDPDTKQVSKEVRRQTSYLIEIIISDEKREGSTRAARAFPEEQLPPSAEPHRLQVVLCELFDHGQPQPTEPQVIEIRLPATGPSTRAEFPIRTGEKHTYKARVIVLHRGRVLQTLLLQAPLDSSWKSVSLDPETVIHPGFAALQNRGQFDGALVLNENAAGEMGVLSTDGTVAGFNAPDVDSAIQQIRNALNKLTKLSEKKVDFKNPEVRKVLVDLAYYGNFMHDEVEPKLAAGVKKGLRLQVVEAKPGAFLPVEFFYQNLAPEDDAEFCPHGLEELKKLTQTEGSGEPSDRALTECPNENSRRYVCPTAFWGFTRVIEHRPPGGIVIGEYHISEPTLKVTHLDLLRQTVVAASSKVRVADVQPPDGVLTRIAGASSHPPIFAKNWTDWTAKVKAHKPSLLVLFPHTLIDPPVKKAGKTPAEIRRQIEEGKEALEIGRENLRVGFIEFDHVTPQREQPGPVILLLGCSTSLPINPLQNCVSRFRVKGASLVVGTLSLIKGRHAARFAGRLVELLSQHSGEEGVGFGDVLLEAKQKMFVEGDPFALTLVAYGNVDWRL